TGLCRDSEDPQRAPCPPQLAGQVLVFDPGHPRDVRGPVAEKLLELAATDQPERQLGCEARCGENRLETVQRDQLADEQARESFRSRPAWLEQAFLCADEADLDTACTELAEAFCVCLRVGDDEIR